MPSMMHGGSDAAWHTSVPDLMLSLCNLHGNNCCDYDSRCALHSLTHALKILQSAAGTKMAPMMHKAQHQQQ